MVLCPNVLPCVSEKTIEPIISKGAGNIMMRPELLESPSFTTEDYSVKKIEKRLERVEGRAEDRFRYFSKSPAMTHVNEMITYLRKQAMKGESEESNILIRGEAGTEREGIARTIYAGSRRGKGPWFHISCANSTEKELERELFGNSTGEIGILELADQGTLFLDEIYALSLDLQNKIMQFILEKTYISQGTPTTHVADVRIIAGSTLDLKEKVSSQKFREDLYQKVSQVSLEIPPLRDRSNEILNMAYFFAERAFSNLGKKFLGFTQDAGDFLQEHSWPGNTHELYHLIERASLITAENAPVSITEILPSRRTGNQTTVKPALVISPFANGFDSYMQIKKNWNNNFEKDYLAGALERHEGNVSSAAREAKLDRSNFLRLLRRHGLRAQEFRKAA